MDAKILLLSSLLLAAPGGPSPATTEPIAPNGDAPPAPRAAGGDLAQKIAALLVGFEGEVGVYVKHLARGDEVAIRADDVFPTASLVKVPILLRLFDRVDRGELGYHDEFAYDASKWDRGGEDLASRFRDGVEVPLSKLVMLMITTSDNTASLWCQDLAGTGTAVNAWLASNGFEATRVNSRTAGREAAYAEWGWGQTTPREMARFLVGVRRGEFVSKAASEEMYRCLTRMYWNDEALAFVPPWVCAAAKQGAISHSRSEVVLVNAPSGDYVFCVITKNQSDKGWEYGNPGFQLLRDVSRTLWQHFEPDSDWRPAEGMERYW